MKKETRLGFKESAEASEKTKELYKEKKELGASTFKKLVNTFYAIVEKYSDVLESVSVQVYVSRENPDKTRLEVALEELLGYKEILDGYTTKLQKLNEEIAVVEDKLGVENIEQDGDMLILRTEANFKGDDLAYRPIKEWYEPLIQNIKDAL